MKIEVLYPEVANLYGDSANIMYLKQILEDATFIETNLNNKPKFIDEKIDLVYIGTSSEEHQELIIKDLMPYKDKINEKIENNQVFLATGNAQEIFGKYILDDDKKIDALSIFDFYAKRNMKKRHNSLFLGSFNDIKIVGNKSQFSFSYDVKNPFIKVLRGVGNNKEDNYEGFNYKNFYGTYLLGPFLIINPYFTKYLLNKIGYDKEIKYFSFALDAYNYRLKELEDPKTSVISKH